LLNLSTMTRHAGDRVDIFAPNDYPLAYATNGEELNYHLKFLIGEGLLEGPDAQSDPQFVPIFNWVRVSLKGWARFDWIYTQGIEPAVREAGYQPLILNKQEHADRVDERIVLELNRSRFVVAEFAQHRPSVYFEAGYAIGTTSFGSPRTSCARAFTHGFVW
jgi:hypothetical protein